LRLPLARPGHGTTIAARLVPGSGWRRVIGHIL